MSSRVQICMLLSLAVQGCAAGAGGAAPATAPAGLHEGVAPNHEGAWDEPVGVAGECDCGLVVACSTGCTQDGPGICSWLGVKRVHIPSRGGSGGGNVVTLLTATSG
jgi:hypothetical protein